MILERKVIDGTVKLVTPDGKYFLRTHEVSDDCWENGCCIHNPSDNVMSSFPYNWREDRGIMERICPHGVGHPDYDSARFHVRNGSDYENVHGCDGCCMPVNTINPDFEEKK